MPNLRTYSIFISHAWRYSDDYNRLVKLLNEAPLFRWRNYSDPKHDPVIGPDTDVSRRKMKEEVTKFVLFIV